MAQIVTITNPLTGQPAQVDQLDHTAQEIDDAIARALPGGAIDVALQNNDPRNWGLGKLIGKYVADLNTHLENGWYYTDASTLNCPVNAGAIVEVSNRDNTIEVQTFWYWMGSGILIKVERLFNGTEWRPWEWDNPPMELGGIDADGNPINEYRTTERYLGKPVYTQVITVDGGVAGTIYFTEKKVSGADQLVGYDAKLWDWSIPTNILGGQAGNSKSIIDATVRVDTSYANGFVVEPVV